MSRTVAVLINGCIPFEIYSHMRTDLSPMQQLDTARDSVRDGLHQVIDELVPTDDGA